jgi:hypothetical protein
VAETAGTARGGPEPINLHDLSAHDWRDDELCDAVGGINCDGVLAQVDQDDFEFAAIIGVDGAGRIQYGEPFLERAATPGPHLPLKPRWYFNCNSSRYRGSRERREHQRFVKRRKQIDARGLRALITGQGSAQALNFDDRNNQSIAFRLL